MKILVIDDNMADRDLIITHIKKAKNRRDITTEESNCLKDALEKIDKNNYDVILLDLILPETDGIDTVQSIISKLKKVNKNIPIIILTGMDNYKIGRQAWDLGIVDYLNKDEMQSKDLVRALNFATFNPYNEKKSILI
jgi:CheY-like chemotaxis protein